MTTDPTPVVVREREARLGAAPDRRVNADDLLVRLRLRSPAELAAIDAHLRSVEAVSGLGWMRRVDESAWHEIREIVSGGVSTWCAGSADSVSVAESFDLEARPLVSDRCRLCEQLRVQRLQMQRGLDELVENTELTRG
jgi:hypothetical protein